MNHFYFRTSRIAALTSILCALALPAFAGPGSAVVFPPGGNLDSPLYLGFYAAADQALTVDVDGTVYKGHYARQGLTTVSTPPSASGGNAWGSAFLFASSAKILQCRLDQGLPQMLGQCQDAQGRQFRLQAASLP